jgi:hypothetical protein
MFSNRAASSCGETYLVSAISLSWVWERRTRRAHRQAIFVFDATPPSEVIGGPDAVRRCSHCVNERARASTSEHEGEYESQPAAMRVDLTHT